VTPDSERPPKDPRQGLRTKVLSSLALAVLLYLGFLVWSDWRLFAAALARFPVVLLVPVLALAFGNYLVRYVKFDLYLRLLGYEVGRRRGLHIFLAGLAGTVTPGKLGEVLKSFLLERDCGAPLARTAPIVVAERYTDLMALVLLTMVGLGDIEGDWWPVLAGGALVTGMFVVVSWRSLCHGIIDVLRARSGAVGRAAEKLGEAYDSTVTLLAPRQLPWPTTLSVFAWFCECLGFCLVLRGFGVEVSMARATCIYCFATLAGALAMLPGGLGATEAVMTAFLTRFGADSGEAVAATLVIRACTLWFAVAVGGLSLATMSPPDKN